MSWASPVQIVEEFWDAVWNERNPDAIDRFVIDDFILISGGKEIRSKKTSGSGSETSMRWLTI